MSLKPPVAPNTPLPDGELFVSAIAHGARADGSTNDGTALQAALNAAGEAAVAGNPGKTVFLPPGVYRYTTALNVPEGVSLQGVGRSSVLKPEGCDGLVFEVSDYVGPQVFEGFYINGNGYTQTAVKALGDADSGRITGVTFQDVFISSFKTAFHLRSTHGWHLSHVNCIFVWEGIKIAGQTILFTLDGGSEFSRDSATGSGDSKGFQVLTASDYNPGGTTEKGAEGIRITDTTFFGFRIGVDHVSALDSVYERLTIGLVGDTAFKITSRQGGLRFRDSWIGFDDNAIYGVRAIGLGSAWNTSVLVIEGIHTAVESGKVTDANSVGIDIATNHGQVIVRDNTLSGLRLHDIRLNFALKVTVEDNNCLSTVTGSSIQIVAFPGGPYYLQRNSVAGIIFEHASNTGQVHRPGVMATVASAAALTLPGGELFTITGTTNITSIAATSTWAGRVIRLVFSGALTFTDGSNLKLAGNLVTTADDSITLACFDGTNWVEISRSIN